MKFQVPSCYGLFMAAVQSSNIYKGKLAAENKQSGPSVFLITIMNICSKSGNPVTCFINYTTPRPEMIPILGVKTAGISHMVKAKVQVIIYPATFCRQMLSG